MRRRLRPDVPAPSSQVKQAASGLLVICLDDANVTGAELERIDPAIDFTVQTATRKTDRAVARAQRELKGGSSMKGDDVTPSVADARCHSPAPMLTAGPSRRRPTSSAPRARALFFACLFALSGLSMACGQVEDPEPDPESLFGADDTDEKAASRPIQDLIGGAFVFSDFEALLVASGVASDMDTPPYTVFVPWNAAFDKLPAYWHQAKAQPVAWRAHLRELANAHMHSGLVSDTQSEDVALPMWDGTVADFRVERRRTLDGIAVIASTPALDGHAYAIDEVRLPAWTRRTALDIVDADPRFSVLKSLLTQGDRALLMAVEGLTLFAPTNAAFGVALGAQLSEEVDIDIQDYVVDGLMPYAFTPGGVRVTLSGTSFHWSVDDAGQRSIQCTNAEGESFASVGVEADQELANNGIVHPIANLACSDVCTDCSPENGLSATYFDNDDFTGTSIERIDPVIDFDWGRGSPVEAIEPNTFTVRWTGYIEADHSETYTFHTVTDDGARLWVDGQLLVDDWTSHPARENTAAIELEGGRHYPIIMEFLEESGGAVARLFWSSESVPKQIIPAAKLLSGSPTGDACPDDSLKTSPGLCGCGVEDSDRDADGTVDCLDECPNDPDKLTPGECGCGIADGHCSAEVRKTLVFLVHVLRPDEDGGWVRHDNENSVEDLRSTIFGDNLNSVRNGFDKCSGGRIDLQPTEYGEVIEVDVVSESNGLTSLGNSAGLLWEQENGVDIEDVADQVIYCIPGGASRSEALGTTDMLWVAGDMCVRRQTLMHELGHSLGLSHAHGYRGGQMGINGDGTGLMGYDGVLAGAQCFNSSENWHLGWFHDRRLTVEAPEEGSVEVEIGAFLDYDWFTDDQVALVKVGPYYLHYIAEAFDMDNVLRVNHDASVTLLNQVAVSKTLNNQWAPEFRYSTGYTAAYGGVGMENPLYGMQNFNGKDTLYVKACRASEGSDTEARSMLVSFGYDPEVLCGETRSQFAVRQSASDTASERLYDQSVVVNSSPLRLFGEGDEEVMVGLRFAALDIPRGARIKHAYIQFEGAERHTMESTSMRIEGQLSPNAREFSGTARDVSSRAPTEAHSVWKTQGWEQWSHDFPERTPDLSDIINELIAQGDWRRGNSLSFLLSREYAGNPNKRPGTTNIADGKPVLVVQYDFECVDGEQCPSDLPPNTGAPKDDGALKPGLISQYYKCEPKCGWHPGGPAYEQLVPVDTRVTSGLEFIEGYRTDDKAQAMWQYGYVNLPEAGDYRFMIDGATGLNSMVLVLYIDGELIVHSDSGVRDATVSLGAGTHAITVQYYHQRWGSYSLGLTYTVNGGSEKLFGEDMDFFHDAYLTPPSLPPGW